MDASKSLYYLDYNLFTSYEIFLNDVKIVNNIESGPVSGMVYLNEFILKSGIQKLKVREFLVNINTPIPSDLVNRVTLDIYTTDKNEENIKKIKEFKIPLQESPKPYFYEFEFEFKAEVPYELEAWTNGRDLMKIDHESLRNKVVNKFEELKKTLNEGRIDEFLSENKKGLEEFFVSNYFDMKKENQYKFNIIEGFNGHKDLMQPLDNFEMVICGNGKLVTLERIDKKFRGESPLMSINRKEETIYTDYIFLYMPKGSDFLCPIRLQVNYDALDEYE